MEESKLREFLKDKGEIIEISMRMDRRKKFLGSCYVTMDTPENAEKVISLDGSEFMGRKVVIQYAQASKEFYKQPTKNSSDGCTVFIGNLTATMEAEEIKQKIEEEFAECGQIEEVRMVYAKDTGEFKRCAFIKFSTKESAEKSLEFNATFWYGSKLRIKINE
eukprot:TRINITY_DN5886_c0_g1_i2.p1 TRINITY_DN5886_c0_g1~~TRINITY_DN5886_c0_g1_i2.p1  ORF type:complete len:163 (+),score=26.07 TRINITY_DN5886_c0_g1_i2:207-695(+)